MFHPGPLTVAEAQELNRLLDIVRRLAPGAIRADAPILLDDRPGGLALSLSNLGYCVLMTNSEIVTQVETYLNLADGQFDGLWSVTDNPDQASTDVSLSGTFTSYFPVIFNVPTEINDWYYWASSSESYTLSFGLWTPPIRVPKYYWYPTTGSYSLSSIMVGNATIGGPAGKLYLSGGTLLFDGGTPVLAGSSLGSGTIAITGGEIAITGASPEFTVSGASATVAGGSLTLSGATIESGNIVINPASLTLNGSQPPVTVGASTLNLGGGSVSFSGDTIGSGSLTLNASTLNLTDQTGVPPRGLNITIVNTSPANSFLVKNNDAAGGATVGTIYPPILTVTGQDWIVQPLCTIRLEFDGTYWRQLETTVPAASSGNGKDMYYWTQGNDTSNYNQASTFERWYLAGRLASNNPSSFFGEITLNQVLGSPPDPVPDNVYQETLTALPFDLPRGGRVDRLRVWVNWDTEYPSPVTLGVNLAIYANDSDDQTDYPGSLIWTSGPTVGSAPPGYGITQTGWTPFDFDLTSLSGGALALPAGLYWIVSNFSGNQTQEETSPVELSIIAVESIVLWPIFGFDLNLGDWNDWKGGSYDDGSATASFSDYSQVSPGVAVMVPDWPFSDSVPSVFPAADDSISMIVPNALNSSTAGTGDVYGHTISFPAVFIRFAHT